MRLITLALSLLIIPVLFAEELEQLNTAPVSPTQDRDRSSDRIWRDRVLQAHKSIYVLPYSLISKGNYASKNSEFKAQFSFKIPLNGEPETNTLYFAFTHQMVFQVYDVDNSRPMRDNDYSPELFYTFFMKDKRLDIGYAHESNGREDPYSRSWDRFLSRFFYYGKRFDIYASIWWILAEDQGDANDVEYGKGEDIVDYYGIGEFKFTMKFGGLYSSYLVRYNPFTNKGAIANDITFPIFNKVFYWYMNIFHGYGDSLIDYNKEITRVGVGVMFNRF